jgi:hypothetical protein
MTAKQAVAAEHVVTHDPNVVTHADLLAHAGSNYAKPKRIHLGSLDVLDYSNIGELIVALQDFRDAHVVGDTCMVESDFCHGDESRSTFDAYRLETPNETQHRIQHYRDVIIQRREANVPHRRLLYEQLKKEFG